MGSFEKFQFEGGGDVLLVMEPREEGVDGTNAEVDAALGEPTLTETNQPAFEAVFGDVKG
jgi:hypothetical protein